VMASTLSTVRFEQLRACREAPVENAFSTSGLDRLDPSLEANGVYEIDGGVSA